MAWVISATAPLARIGGQELAWAMLTSPIESIALVHRSAGSADEWVAVGQAIIGDVERVHMTQDLKGFVDWLLGVVNAGLKSMFGQPSAAAPTDVQSLAAWLMRNTVIEAGADGVPQVRVR